MILPQSSTMDAVLNNGTELHTEKRITRAGRRPNSMTAAVPAASPSRCRRTFTSMSGFSPRSTLETAASGAIL